MFSAAEVVKITPMHCEQPNMHSSGYVFFMTQHTHMCETQSVMVITLTVDPDASRGQPQRGVKVVYLRVVVTLKSLWVTRSSRGPVRARVTTWWRTVTSKWPQLSGVLLSHRVEIEPSEHWVYSWGMTFTSWIIEIASLYNHFRHHFKWHNEVNGQLLH